MSKYNRRKVIVPGDAPTPPPDDFISFWQKVLGKIVPHLGLFMLAIVGGLVVAVAAWGVGQLTGSRREDASVQLAEAVHIYQAELLTDKPDKNAPPEDDTPRFKTEKERADATLAALDKLDSERRGSDAAIRGKLVRAGVLFDLGRFDDAIATYHQFLDSKPEDPALLALAREGLGLSDEAKNQADAALAIYQEPVPGGFYKDHFLMDQARIYTKKGDKKKAIDLYKEIVAMTPQSPLHDDASNHITALEP